MASTHPIKTPEGLDRRSKHLYRELLAVLKAQGTWKDTDEALLESYVRALELARKARESVDSLYSTGSTGQQIAHPGLKLAREAEADAFKYAEALLLTPGSRARAGLKEQASTETLSDLLG